MKDSTEGASKFIVSVTVIMATVMVVMDMTVANVALPRMEGALGASSEQITWVLTGYIVTQAIFIPLTGYFSRLLNEKRLMLVSVIGFVVTSALCGQADSLGAIVLYRVFQGIFGAFIVPLSQSILANTYPREELGKAMALWGMGVMLGPIMGPTIGGYVTENLSWRWVFYINVPVGLLTILLIQTSIKPTKAEPGKINWLTISLMAVGIGAFQMVLDQGQQYNWFKSPYIQMLGFISVVALVLFIRRAWSDESRIVNIQLLKDRNLALASFIGMTFGLGMFGMIMIQPMLYEGLLNYSTETAGLVMAPRGLASAVSMFVVSKIIDRYDPRKIIFLGIILSAIGTYFTTQYSMAIDLWWATFPGIIQGFGLGLIFVPLATLAYASIDPKYSVDAAGLFNLARNLGSSIGISVASAVLIKSNQANWNNLGGNISPYNSALQNWADKIGLSLESPVTTEILGLQLKQQAYMSAFVDTLQFIMWSFLFMSPLLLLIKWKPKADMVVPDK